mmetsp:Transcript_5181/g.18872  ORF Transcript_5181/g.18872 Transcript_5181/m.18872 type:complete len:202 (-) Transcript_5181:1068-1673(-)
MFERRAQRAKRLEIILFGCFDDSLEQVISGHIQRIRGILRGTNQLWIAALAQKNLGVRRAEIGNLKAQRVIRRFVGASLTASNRGKHVQGQRRRRRAFTSCDHRRCERTERAMRQREIKRPALEHAMKRAHDFVLVVVAYPHAKFAGERRVDFGAKRFVKNLERARSVLTRRQPVARFEKTLEIPSHRRWLIGKGIHAVAE